MNRPQPSSGAAAATLAELVYELLDAHQDTAELFASMAPARSWEVHLDYLRALQRTGREVLARAASEVPDL
jgi:hypothetical protein